MMLLPLLAAAGTATAPAAQAQIRRCVAPDGGTVYTDRACSAVGATAGPQRGARPTAANAYRGGCQRHLRGLIQEMSHAIDSRDTNRLASLYHWRGLDNAGGYRALDRLDAIAQRPLVDIVAQRPAASVATEGPGGFAGWSSARELPAAARVQPPSSLRVIQTGPGGTGASQTVFSLHRHFDCWWVRL
ncbi:DUF4124 domain-containing protein [Luteimonas sp. FCS-9]|uniref:DUF4124 domain-containing protein n=1 Tax=Luteimonas sp. FCS-9 TaxID=1547516 RepID=UPI00063EC44D|nr:DUF4124 domain-containing protein [Luteimonas sp. FCS-9]KLJ01001.1 hypothetical protein WQ56_07085 [Luteimonas sp. FCS-9]